VKWRETLERRAMNDATPLNPQRVFHELSPHLPADAMIACDTGTTVHWYSRHLDLRDDMWAAHSGGLASMGAAVPYAIAAKFAHPDRPAIALVGDGAMQMNGINELITVAKYWRTWTDPRFIVLVMNNRDLNMVSWEQRVLEGEPKFPASQDAPDFPYAEYARLLGFEAMSLDGAQQVAAAWERAFRADRPVLVEAVVDPNVVPLPPHVTPAQARNYLKSLLNGDPDAKAVVKASIRELFT
jgi:pyruvate dehydrogenase (quinone)